MDPSDYRVVKILVFSRAVTQAVFLLGDLTGMYKPVGGSSQEGEDPRRFTVESALGVAFSLTVSLIFVYEIETMTESLKN